MKAHLHCVVPCQGSNCSASARTQKKTKTKNKTLGKKNSNNNVKVQLLNTYHVQSPRISLLNFIMIL